MQRKQRHDWDFSAMSFVAGHGWSITAGYLYDCAQSRRTSRSGYTNCPCCGDITVSDDESKPELCTLCFAEGCADDGSDMQCDAGETHAYCAACNAWCPEAAECPRTGR